MKIVGIDASLTSTGVAVFDNSKEIAIFTKAITTDLIGVERLSFVQQKIFNEVDPPGECDLIVLENYAFAKAEKAHQTGELGGVLRLMFHHHGIPWIVAAPTQVKKFATGEGKATKEKIAVACYKHWGVEFNTNDEADAYVLMRIGMALKGIGVDKLTGYQKEIVKTISKEKK